MTARTRRNPDGMFISPGAVAQHDGLLPGYICNGCGSEVVWCSSKRTGKKYLVNVSHGLSGARFYVGRNVHKCQGKTS
jgi:hypothetical protein